MDFSDKNVAVLDTIHGAREICKKLRETGAKASAINIYHDPPSADFIDSFDVVVTPVHAHTALAARADALGIPLLTHHQAVGQLVDQTEILHDALVFEVTGVKGKTSTAGLLSSAYANRRLLSLTSLGLEIYADGKYIAKKRLSITPASILSAIDLAKEFDFDPEVCIFEVSLGGTGLADVNVITTFSPEYKIAARTKTSTSAKLEMITNAKANSCIVVPMSEKPLLHHAGCLNTFGDGLADVRYENTTGRDVTITCSRLKTIDGRFTSAEIRFPLSGYFNFESYKSALLCFTAAALSANNSPEAISGHLSHFKGVSGRMSAATIKERFLVDNSNSGLDVTSITEAIQYGLTFKKVGSKVVLVIGMEANVCEGIDLEALASLAKRDDIDHVVFVGDFVSNIGNDVTRVDSLENALRKALELTRPNDVIVSCVKMWR